MSMTLSLREEKIFNEGERLIPGITHNHAETVRHRSSYQFWYDLILKDIENKHVSEPKILDLGCGVGHGCKLLSHLPGSEIVGVDMSSEAIEYAEYYYSAKNVHYEIGDITKLPPSYYKNFDYVVSRAVLEHIENGIKFVVDTFEFKARLMIDVPYKEEPGNQHHILLNIDESIFSSYQNVELFYQTLGGELFSEVPENEKPNVIMSIFTSPGFPNIDQYFSKFPISPWSLESEPVIEVPARREWFSSDKLFAVALENIKPTDIALELGAGLHNNELALAPFQILCEPYDVYIPVLKERLKNSNYKLYSIIEETAQKFLPQLPNKSIDTILLIDVIEHLEKEMAKKVLKECERVARQQVIIFTPLGFLPQDHPDGIENWGLTGGEWQDGHSGWEPEDFDSTWSFFGSKEFHEREIDGEMRMFGAFFAIKNYESEKLASSHIIGGLISAIAELTKKQITFHEEINKKQKEINKKQNSLKEENEKFSQKIMKLENTISLISEDLKSTKQQINMNVEKDNQLYQQINEVRYSYYHKMWMKIYTTFSPLSQKIRSIFGKKD